MVNAIIDAKEANRFEHSNVTVNAVIDGNPVSVPEGTTIMEAAALLGIEIPRLCYMKDVNVVGACRVCVVDVEGFDRVVSSCNHLLQEGMVIHTSSPRVRSIRKTNVQLILSQHESNCPICLRNGNCGLQSISRDMGLLSVPYKQEAEPYRWESGFPIVRSAQKCIKCMRCVNICENVQSLGVWDVVNTGYRTTVGVQGNKAISESNCAACGQCVIHCPVGALSVRKDGNRVYEALNDPDVITVVQVAPAVRAAFCEKLDLEPGALRTGQLVAALKKVGFDYVFDTDFTADLTIMEEGSELLERLGEIKESGWPMFTSCCPGWVRFLRSEYPALLPRLSSAKSPQQMFGAVIKTWFARQLDVDPSKIFVISVMPCSAKKYECTAGMDTTGTGSDVDAVLLTREMMKMVQMDHIDVAELEDEPFDSPFGAATGAGVIFGASGGVMEAALRSAYYLLTGENIDPEAFPQVRGHTARRELDVTVGDATVRCAVVSSLGEARGLIEDIEAGRAQYDFVEVMACPGGCAAGGGQPIKDGCVRGPQRSKVLYSLDRASGIRYSHENAEVGRLYAEFLEKPLSHKAHQLLHTDQSQWRG